jgi:predicted nucleic acid-binding Zn ribbon protein
MRKTNTQPLKEVLQEYVKALKMGSKLKEVRLIGSWEQVVGKVVGRATRDLYIKDRVLYVKLSSSVVKNELFMMRDLLVERLNEEVGSDVIKEVVFI